LRLTRDGIPAAPGIVIGPAHVLRLEIPRVPHVMVAPEEVDREIERFHEAREWAKARIREVRDSTEARLGEVEAHIFDPQLLMLDDAELIDGTVEYIRENRLSAARAFELRMVEFQSEWRRTGHPMVMDRLNDLMDVGNRVIRRLLGIEDPDHSLQNLRDKVILVARDLTPSLTVQLDREKILGIATDAGTRTSHSAILARALGIPAVVSLGDLSQVVQSGQELILDGRAGRVVVEPTEWEKNLYRELSLIHS